MKFIKPRVDYIIQQEGLDGIYKMIEKVGRVSYKSEDKITDNSAKSFVDRLIRSKHYSPLEFGTVYLTIPYKNEEHLIKYFINNPYSKVINPYKDSNYYITTNYRVLVEGELLSDVEPYISPIDELHAKRLTLKFVCSRAIAQEITRHRKFSYCMESQRYCNYNKDKFNNEVTFIKPTLSYDLRDIKSDKYEYAIDILLEAFSNAEKYYNLLIKEGFKPEEAREVLPNATKTELVVCGFYSDWKHFFQLRFYGTTGKPHPDMLNLTSEAKKVLSRYNIWHEIFGIDYLE